MTLFIFNDPAGKNRADSRQTRQLGEIGPIDVDLKADEGRRGWRKRISPCQESKTQETDSQDKKKSQPLLPGKKILQKIKAGPFPLHVKLLRMKANPPAGQLWWSHQLPDGIKQRPNLSIVALQFALQLCQFSGKFAAAGQHPFEFDEHTHDGDVHLDRPLAAQDAGEHGNTLFRENKR